MELYIIATMVVIVFMTAVKEHSSSISGLIVTVVVSILLRIVCELPVRLAVELVLAHN